MSRRLLRRNIEAPSAPPKVTSVGLRPPPLCQIAFSVTDLRRTHRWYREALGFLPAGGTRMFRGPLASRVQGLPRAASTCWWLVDGHEFFQLELFQFTSPRPRPAPPDRRLNDIGYSMVGLHVSDFDAALARLDRLGSGPLTEPVGPAGARRVCVRDPEGVLLELMEDDADHGRSQPRAGSNVPVAVRSVTLSVADLERSRRFFVDALGLDETEAPALHGPEHERLWGLEGAVRSALELRAGDFVVELVQYERPAGRPWPDGYRISDQGILNVAFGFRDRRAFERTYSRCLARGHRGNWRPLELGVFTVVYVNDDQGFSVELLRSPRWAEGVVGFRASRGEGGPAGRRAAERARSAQPLARPSGRHRAEVAIRIAAPRTSVWERIADHERLPMPWPAKGSLASAGDPERNGLGAVRLVRLPGFDFEEEIVGWDPPAGYEYAVTRGTPLGNHRGRLTLRELAEETEVRWAAEFDLLVPGMGAPTAAILRWSFRRVLSSLKAELEAA